jgi:hypothetical protein
MKGIETQQVTVKGFLVAAKVDQDNDIHAEIAGSPEWDTPHLIAEVPPGQEYCSARKALWEIVKADLPQHSVASRHILRHPQAVELTGFVFLDTAHGKTDFCHTAGAGECAIREFNESKGFGKSIRLCV